jgi:hypothetical protein
VVEQPLLEGAGAVEVDVALQHAVEHGQQAGQPGVPPEDAADQPAQPAGVAGPLGLQGGVQVGEPGVEPLGGQGQEQALLGPVVEERRPLGQPGLLGDAGHGHLGYGMAWRRAQAASRRSRRRRCLSSSRRARGRCA